MEQSRVIDHQKTLYISPENRIFTLFVQTPAKTLGFSFLLKLMLDMFGRRQKRGRLKGKSKRLIWTDDDFHNLGEESVPFVKSQGADFQNCVFLYTLSKWKKAKRKKKKRISDFRKVH